MAGSGGTSELLVREEKVLVQGWEHLTGVGAMEAVGALGDPALREICILGASPTGAGDTGNTRLGYTRARNNIGGSVIRCYFLNEFSCDIIKSKRGDESSNLIVKEMFG